MASKDFGQNGKNKPHAKQDSVGSDDNSPFRGYINVNLTDLEKQAYPEWAKPETVFEVFAAAVASGVNVSVKREVKSQGFLASGTQRDIHSVNAGLCVTARAKDPVTAFGRLMFILGVLNRSENWEDTAPLASPDRW